VIWAALAGWWRKATTARGGLPVPPELAEAEREDDVLEVAGQLAIVEALRLWQLDVYDPRRADKTAAADRSRAVIDDIARSDRGAGWSWLPPYAGDGAVEWCGMFAAWCWGASIPLPTRKTWWPSTYRLDTWARYAPMDAHKNPRPAVAGDARLYCIMDEAGHGLTFEPRAGDIGLVGDGNPVYGDHVVLVERYDAARRMLVTVEGNGGGVGPRGNRRQGIVRAERPVGRRPGGGYYLRRLIRPGLADIAPF